MQPTHTYNAVSTPSQPTRSQRLAALGHALLERLETPLFVTDSQGLVLEANPSATCRFERREGTILKPYQRALKTGDALSEVDCPTVWRAEPPSARRDG